MSFLFPSVATIFLFILLGSLSFYLIYSSLPKKIRLNANGIFVINPFNSVKKITAWHDIQSIEEHTFYRCIFFLLFGEKYRRLTIIDNQFSPYYIYDYSYEEYDTIIEIIYSRVNSENIIQVNLN
jgi:hypothetical protein